MIFSYQPRHRQTVMNAFNIEVKDGVLVDKSTGNRIRDNLQSDLTPKKFGGVRKGSLEFINKDIASLMKLRNKLKEG